MAAKKKATKGSRSKSKLRKVSLKSVKTLSAGSAFGHEKWIE